VVETISASIVDVDLSKYFDTIPHRELIQCVARRIVDRDMLHLLKMWLKPLRSQPTISVNGSTICTAGFPSAASSSCFTVRPSTENVDGRCPHKSLRSDDRPSSLVPIQPASSQVSQPS
jgi:hypothetical protein